MTSHTVLIEFNCKPGIRDSILDGLRNALPETRGFDGAELIEVYVDADEPDRLIFWEKWSTRHNQEAYLQWRTETGVLAAFSDLLSQPPRFTHLEPADA
jgi:quinol monooxygenase YgiN